MRPRAQPELSANAQRRAVATSPAWSPARAAHASRASRIQRRGGQARRQARRQLAALGRAGERGERGGVTVTLAERVYARIKAASSARNTCTCSAFAPGRSCHVSRSGASHGPVSWSASTSPPPLSPPLSLSLPPPLPIRNGSRGPCSAAPPLSLAWVCVTCTRQVCDTDSATSSGASLAGTGALSESTVEVEESACLSASGNFECAHTTASCESRGSHSDAGGRARSSVMRPSPSRLEEEEEEEREGGRCTRSSSVWLSDPLSARLSPLPSTRSHVAAIRPVALPSVRQSAVYALTVEAASEATACTLTVSVSQPTATLL
mmetsp:Transcript_33022/g.82104  ORF Transcript_33022/g.82104 Transcript_33022/m.82104 type:complete len:321 (+) Transcript_33022:499-1461(+)